VFVGLCQNQNLRVKAEFFCIDPPNPACEKTAHCQRLKGGEGDKLNLSLEPTSKLTCEVQLKQKNDMLFCVSHLSIVVLLFLCLC
jgi:hypothetical protein